MISDKRPLAQIGLSEQYCFAIYFFIILISVLTLFIHTLFCSVSETNSAGLDKLWYCES